MEGHFIVLEGIDGSGTTSQMHRLCGWFRSRGLASVATHEPTLGPVGAIIRQVLMHRIVTPGAHGTRPPSWQTMGLLFAADRLDHVETEILPNLMDGVHVVSDRYDLSSLAYQTAISDSEDDAKVVEWIRTLNRYARRPDLTIVLDVPADLAAERRRARGGPSELYETSELQIKLAAAYLRAEELLPDDHIVHVDGTGSMDAVTAAIVEHVEQFRKNN